MLLWPLRGSWGPPGAPADNSRPNVDVCQAHGIAVQALAVVPMNRCNLALAVKLLITRCTGSAKWLSK